MKTTGTGARIPTIRNMDLDGKPVFVRTEFNVPLTESLEVADETRILEVLPTLRWVIDQGARTVIGSHRGRPWGTRDPKDSLRCVVKTLERHLEVPIRFVEDCVGPERDSAVEKLASGEILLLENIRYYIEENKNDRKFAEQLSRGIEVYVNDAFGNCHRPHASMVSLPGLIPSRCFGFLVEKELKALAEFTENPSRPLILIIGGAKVAGKDGKIHVINNLLPKTDSVLMGGRIASFFLAARGLDVGETLTDFDRVDSADSDIESEIGAAREVLERAERMGVEIVLPLDVLAAESPRSEGNVQCLDASSINGKLRALDIGPKTIERFTSYIMTAETIIWNGPMGFFEERAFAQGTLEVARRVASSSAASLVGGGDSVKAVKELGLGNRMTHVSTGGGAMLTYLMGRSLPGVEAVVDGGI